MNLPDKNRQVHTFEKGINTDDAPELVPANQARYILNCRTFSFGNTGVITNVKGNTLIATPLPSGTNKTIGTTVDEATNRFFFAVYNSEGYHTIFQYNATTNNITRIIQSITDTGGVDILRFDPDYLILHWDIVDHKLSYFVDGLNKARKFNISKALDKTSTGYGISISEDFITAYKQTAIYAPTCAYITDVTRNSNNLYGNLFKFAQQFVYDDGEQSNWSDWSVVPLPQNQSYLGVNNITFDNNAINVQIATGNQLVTKINIAVKINSNDFVICTVLDKAQQEISDNSTYTYVFYNDGSYSTVDPLKVSRLYNYLPRVPKCQSFVKLAMTYSNFDEGFANVIVKASVACNLIDLYLPDNTQNQLNNPQFIVTETGHEGQGSVPIFTSGRVNSSFHFVVGYDVKKGNNFQVFGRNGSNDNYYNVFPASESDTSITIANKIKSWLRSIGRGNPSANGGISNETVDAQGNVSWDYGYLGQWGKSKTTFTGTVNPVSFTSLKDNGSSIQLIKYGGVRNYAFVYEDDDGRSSLAYTSPDCVIRTPFVTETGAYKRPVHQITISHLPPVWAKYWRLVRTPDITDFIWLLIQKVITYTTDSHEAYLDLVVGSLPTYNQVHPNSILKYDFTAGDRLRLIKSYDPDTNVGTFYSTYETEVLSYLTDVEETKNENVTLNGTDTVTIGGTTDASFVGKIISVNGFERTIIAVPSGNQYQLDRPYVNGTSSQPVSYPNYILIDRRGVIRIKKPTNITIEDFSLVEIYKPQQQNVSADYRNYYDFGQKYEIANWGTANAYHRGSVQDQTSSQPAIVTTQNGDSYIRSRELPTNTVFPGTQFIVDNITDPNFSDFYQSDLHDTGKVYPQDNGLGVVHFGSRIRYSNNYIQDTSINGLNDFDSSSREDYNDAYGDIQLTKFLKSQLYTFKSLRDAYVPVFNTMTTGADGNSIVVTTEKLLNQMVYMAYDGGIGDNPESFCYNGNYMYHAMAGAGVFVRIDGEGVEPISQIYKFDQKARQLLAAVQKYKLKIFGGFDRVYDEGIWSISSYTPYLYNSGINPNDWQTNTGFLPAGTTYTITQQPANGSVNYNSATGLLEVTMNAGYVGSDYALYQATLPDHTVLPVRKLCITSTQSANRQKGFVPRSSSAYCVQRNTSFRVRQNSAYCLQNNSTPLADFDYMVLRYIWQDGAGTDLDTFTGFKNTGTIYDGDPTSRTNWVGYNQNGGSRIIPTGSSSPYLNWGADNTGSSGIEAILLDIKQFNTDNPTSNNPVVVRMNAVWYGTPITGNITVEVTTYKGGAMSLDAPNHNFINTGGVLVDQVDLPVTVTAHNQDSLISNSQNVAEMRYNKDTATATLVLV